MTIFPTVTTKVFGSVTGPKIYPFVYMCFSMANLTQYFVLKLFSNYQIMFFLFGGFAIAAMIIGLTFDEDPDWG